MKIQVIKFILFFVILLYTRNIYSQGVSFEATIANQTVVGTDFYFDIYLTRTGTNDLYLGNAQFILTFNSGAFTTPTITKQASSFWNLISSDLTQVGSNYRTNTSVAISGNQLQLSINGPTPSDQEGFDASVAKIDNQASTHLIGRYKVSGITNTSAYMNLQWVSSPSVNPHSRAFTLANADPWLSSEAAGIWTDPPSQPLPVELTSFTSKLLGDKIQLSWETKTEVNNYGFNVERRINAGEWNNIGFVEGHGNSNSPKEYSYLDKDLFSGGSKFQYRLKQVDNDGSFEYSKIVEVEVVPTQFELSQNYPNPFNPNTTIRFSLPKQTQLKLNIYNLLGQLIETIAEGNFEAGYHKITFNGSNLSSGIYIYRLESKDFIQTRKMILMK